MLRNGEVVGSGDRGVLGCCCASDMLLLKTVENHVDILAGIEGPFEADAVGGMVGALDKGGREDDN